MAHLPFPDVTICPPKSLNSALRYDLQMTANMTLGQTKKDNLRKEAETFLIDMARARFVKSLLNLINQQNTGKIMAGVYGFPEETDEGYLVRLSGTE